MGVVYNTKIVTANLLCLVDFANPRNVNTTSKTVKSDFSNLTFSPAANLSYVTLSNNYVTYSRAASANSVEKPTAGGYHISPNMSTYTGLRYNEFYYNDHTFEVWCKILDNNPSNYDVTENNSFLAGHRGYNIGYTYNSSTIYYIIWNTSSAYITPFNFVFGSEIVVGNWYQLAIVRSGNNYYKYINGEYKAANTSAPSPSINGGVSNSATIGIGAQWASGQNYLYYANAAVGGIKMYNRALSNDEIQQNFTAYRGRYGI